METVIYTTYAIFLTKYDVRRTIEQQSTTFIEIGTIGTIAENSQNSQTQTTMSHRQRDA